MSVEVQGGQRKGRFRKDVHWPEEGRKPALAAGTDRHYATHDGAPEK